MYEAFEAVAGELKAMTKMSEPPEPERVMRVAEALAQVASRLDCAMRTATAEIDRANIQTLYRGFVSARRLLMELNTVMQTRRASV